MLSNGTHREFRRTAVEEANGLLKSRMHLPFSMVGGVRNTGHLPKLERCVGPADPGSSVPSQPPLLLHAESLHSGPLPQHAYCAENALVAFHPGESHQRWKAHRLASQLVPPQNRQACEGACSLPMRCFPDRRAEDREESEGESGARQINGVSRVSWIAPDRPAGVHKRQHRHTFSKPPLFLINDRV